MLWVRNFILSLVLLYKRNEKRHFQLFYRVKAKNVFLKKHAGVFSSTPYQPSSVSQDDLR